MKISNSARFLLISLLLSAILCSAAYGPFFPVSAQNDAREKVRKVLTGGAGFSSEDLQELEKGNVVVRQIDAEDPGEVAFCGAVKVEAPRDMVYDAFRRAIELQEKEIAYSRGIFSKPPVTRDLTRLDVGDSEIRGLSDCKVGDCDWSLSDKLIEKVAAEIDWSAPGSAKKADELIKKILVDYTAEYMNKGDAALMTYMDDPEPLSLQEEQRLLLGRLLWIGDFAPEFREYLEKFPAKKLEGVDDLVYWSNVRVGLKPVIIETHTIFYKKEDAGIPQGFIISKQIYANHYFHSSLALTGFISFPKDGGKFDTYVFFVSHSRAGALTGTLGQLARGAVDGEAENKLTDALEDTKRFTRYALEGREEAEMVSRRGFLATIFGRFFYFWLILAGLAVYWFARRRK